jgi:hypothetical protein
MSEKLLQYEKISPGRSQVNGFIEIAIEIEIEVPYFFDFDDDFDFG